MDGDAEQQHRGGNHPERRRRDLDGGGGAPRRIKVEGHLCELQAQQHEENQRGKRCRHVAPSRGALSGKPTEHTNGEVFLLDEQGGKAGGNHDGKQQLAEIGKAGDSRQIKIARRAIIKGEQGDQYQTGETEQCDSVGNRGGKLIQSIHPGHGAGLPETDGASARS